MIWLILGVVLWWAAHLFKRAMPGVRAPMGEAGKGLVATILVASVVLMVIGYRGADGAVFWGRSPVMAGINNLLMLLSFYCLGASAAQPARVWLGTRLRHPQLTGFSIWAFAHLLVNGDVPSFILFGGLLVWALVEMVVIDATEGPWTPPPQAPVKKEITLLVITVVLFPAVAGVHYWLGVPVFG